MLCEGIKTRPKHDLGRDSKKSVARYSGGVNQTGAESLTPRQLGILELVSEGLCNPEIVERLELTEATLKVHIRTIETKFGLLPKTPANWAYNTRTRAAILYLKWKIASIFR